MMATISPFTTASFLIFLLLIPIILLNIGQTQAKQQIRNPNPVLALGMTRSRTFLPSPKASYTRNSPKRPSELSDMMEPLREIRDGYLISLSLGTPPQIIQVYVDTGSDLTWVPCGNVTFNCIECDDYRNVNKLTATFSPSFSSSSARDLCGSTFCINVHSSDTSLDTCTMAGCSLLTLLKATCPRPCPSFAYTYGAGGVITGTLTRDTLRVHGTNKPISVTREIPKFCFGCVGSTYREPIGIAGFGRGALSLPSQLGFLQKGFSHCFLAFKFANNPNISSPLVVGDAAISSKNYLQFTPMLKNPIYPNFYYIGLEAISVGNFSAIKVPLNLRGFDLQGNGAMLIDSGTTYTHLPQPLYSQLLSLLQSAISYPRAMDMEMRTGFDLCYRVPCTNNNIMDDLLPTITFHFIQNTSLVLPQGNHFYAVGTPRNSTVVKCLLFQIMDDGDYGPAGVFGSFQQQNVEVVYDLNKERIGFQPRDCASYAAAQGLHKI